MMISAFIPPIEHGRLEQECGFRKLKLYQDVITSFWCVVFEARVNNFSTLFIYPTFVNTVSVSWIYYKQKESLCLYVYSGMNDGCWHI